MDNNILSDFFKKNIEANKNINIIVFVFTVLLGGLLFYKKRTTPTKIIKEPFFYILIILFIASLILLIYNQENLNKTDEDDRKDKIPSLIWTSVFTYVFFVFLIILILLSLIYGDLYSVLTSICDKLLESLGKIPFIGSEFTRLISFFGPFIGKLFSNIIYVLIGIGIGVFGIFYGVSYKK